MSLRTFINFKSANHKKDWVRKSKNPQYANPQIKRNISVRKFADLRIVELTYGPPAHLCIFTVFF
jgi:hypothetical protein